MRAVKELEVGVGGMGLGWVREEVEGWGKEEVEMEDGGIWMLCVYCGKWQDSR